ncbi:beta-Ig-H3/fasciclin [Nostoc minutum NIES-26]|uniref:Beta-Ig-H3/fasciclin n=1 Tax=Nostoc minutum NIES-26 TaxID=1844469 RepID=A0A367S3H8_9NOSO|nr:fasciclin domain-containing protein [Dendronalium sp. ChiSLP03b]MDZ8205080.1 fasciclin domain-containing protein [Dendronalium sp. ChiSLP03b]RCJ42524.1 beta-Ig-H3/fasciclin [Nostoc minutum NIES-26]
MKANYSKLLTNLASVVGVAGASLLITLPSGAKEATNPNPSIFNEAPYNQSQRILTNTSYTPAEVALEREKGKKPNKQLSQTSGSGATNPRPSIFNEPPYNRGSRTTPSETAPTPTTPEATPPTQVPSTETPTPTPSQGTSNTQGKTLLALAESNSSFTTLTKALKAAGLTGAFQGKDNLTVFAPTDAAFAKLPQDAVQDLLKPENKEVLVKLLTYHVVAGKVLSTDLKSGEVKSLEGGAINVKVDPTTGVTVNDAKVVQADIQGSNGVIHAIDQVILPPDL